MITEYRTKKVKKSEVSEELLKYSKWVSCNLAVESPRIQTASAVGNTADNAQ